MTELKVILGVRKERLFDSYNFADLFAKNLEVLSVKRIAIKDADLEIRKKLIWSGVKMINTHVKGDEDKIFLETAFSLIETIKVIMSTLTPRELETVFPIDKVYDGEKYEVKDYFYTKQYIETFGPDQVIGEEILEFLWEYQNMEVFRFSAQTMNVISGIRRAEGGKGIMEEFLENEGVATYSMTSDQKGKQFLVNNQTGEKHQVKKKRPRHLRLIK